MAIKVIQTTYKGYKFRSRLEARWAVFFDALRLAWEYEPEGYELPSGTYYLPDFWVVINDVVHWFEIKPDNQGETDKFTEFMKSAPEECCGAVLNNIPDPIYVRQNYGTYYPDFAGDRPFKLWGGPQGGWDNNYRFCVCPDCKKIGFEFDGRSARLGCNRQRCPSHNQGNGDKNYSADHSIIIAAFAKARAARFEHDERETY